MAKLNKEAFTFEGGDVEILIKGEDGQTIHGLVYSQVLCLVSDVWKKFIYPPFPSVPSRSKTEKTILATLDFTDDNPDV